MDWSHLWVLVIAVSALSGWWLSLRPDATFRGISPTMSVLIVLMAALMCVLALSSQHAPELARPARGSPAVAMGPVP